MTRKGSAPDEDDDLSVVLQVRVSKRAGAMLEAKAKGASMPVGTYVRRHLYRLLGLIKGETP